MAASAELLILYAKWKLENPRDCAKDFYEWLAACQADLNAEVVKEDKLGGVLSWHYKDYQ